MSTKPIEAAGPEPSILDQSLPSGWPDQPAFRAWLEKEPPAREWYESLTDRERIARAKQLRTDLHQEFSQAFDVRVSNDLRHAAMCRKCGVTLVGTRSDLSVLPSDLRFHQC